MSYLPKKVMPLINHAEMIISHRFKCNFILQEGLCANILHSLQEIVIQFVLMYNMMKVLLQTYYQESGHFISSICLFYCALRLFCAILQLPSHSAVFCPFQKAGMLSLTCKLNNSSSIVNPLSTITSSFGFN